MALFGLAGLIAVAVPLADPGTALVPGAIHSWPEWLRGPYGAGLGIGGDLYFGLLCLAFACYLCVLPGVGLLHRRVVWAAIGIIVLAFTLAPPLASRDVFSYIDYARLGTIHDLNPYLAIPANVRSDPAFAHVGWRDTVSAYGPLFTLLSYSVGQASVGTALWILKALAGVSVLAIAALCARLAPARGIDPQRAVAFVALNPLVLVHVVGGAHNDGLMMLLVLAGVACGTLLLERGQGAALVGAVAVKASALFAAPFALLGSPRRGRLLAGAGIALAVVTTVSLLVYGTQFFAAVTPLGSDVAATTHYSLPHSIAALFGIDATPIRIAMTVLYCGLVAWLLRWTWLGGDWVRAAAWAAVGLLLVSGWLLPWYLLWALPLAALVRDRNLSAVVIALTAFQLLNRMPV